MNNNRLEEFIPMYYEKKKELDSLKSKVDELNKDIKALFNGIDASEFETENLVAKITVQDRTKFNDDRLLIWAKEVDAEGLIATKEYVDTDVLEQLMYNKKLSESQLKALDGCRDINLVQVLSVKPVKR